MHIVGKFALAGVLLATAPVMAVALNSAPANTVANVTIVHKNTAEPTLEQLNQKVGDKSQTVKANEGGFVPGAPRLAQWI